jgi:hypothetical protein
MKMPQLVSRILRGGVVGAAALVALGATTAQAATIQIAFTGMNLRYDGASLYDATSNTGGVGNPANADPLATVDFFVDGSPAGTLNSNISLDVFIPDVTNISAAPNAVYNQVTPGNPGYFDLLFGTSPLASEFLQLDLDNVSVTYVDVSGLVQFTFGAAVAASNAQNLPFALEIGDPVTLSFSAQLDAGSKTTAGGFVTGFRATGTGEIRGEAIPEPSTIALLGMGALAVPVMLRRRRR